MLVQNQITKAFRVVGGIGVIIALLFIITPYLPTQIFGVVIGTAGAISIALSKKIAEAITAT